MNARSKTAFIFNPSLCCGLLLLCLSAWAQNDNPSKEAFVRSASELAAQMERSQAQARAKTEFNTFLWGLTDAQIVLLNNDDPLLIKLYAQRMSGPDGSISWVKVVDQDVLRRTDSWKLLSRLIEAPIHPPNRAAAIVWVANHPELPGARNILEQAIRLFKAEQFRLAELDIMPRIVESLGDASHLVLFDEFTKAGAVESSKRAKERFLQRLAKKAQQDKTPQAGAKEGKSQHEAQAERSDTVASNKFSFTPLWLTLGGIVLAVGGLTLWMVARTGKRRNRA